MPTFDVVVPCYNYARYLERCVKSVLNQEGVEVRVLIIDDCSTDDSAVVGQRLAGSDSRVEFRRHEKNLRHIATYNEGLIGWAKADYCLLLSADDALAPGAFQRALKLFEQSKDVGLVFGMARIITHDDEFRFPDGNDLSSAQIMSGDAFLKFCCERSCNPVPTPTAIVRTSLQQQLGGYRADLPHTGDLEMWMRFARNGSIGIVRSVQGEYRWHGRNMGMQYYTQTLNDRQEFAFTCLDVLTPVLEAKPEAHLWIEAMYSRLLSEAEHYAITAFDFGDRAAHKVWSDFANTLAEKMINPDRSRRLALREALGQPIWKAVRRVRKVLNPALPDAKPLNTIWSPSHGDVSGEWPGAITN